MWNSSLARARAKIAAIPAGRKAWRSRAETGAEVAALAMVNENSLKNALCAIELAGGRLRALEGGLSLTAYCADVVMGVHPALDAVRYRDHREHVKPEGD